MNTFDKPSSSILSVAFTPDGKTVAGGCWKLIYLWDVHTGKLKQTLTSHPSWHRALAFSPDGSVNGTVILWDMIKIRDHNFMENDKNKPNQ